MSALHPAPPRHALPAPTLRIALLDAALTDLADRLAAMGHDVLVHDRGSARAVAACVARRADVAVIGVRDAHLIPVLRARGTAVAVRLTGGGATARRAAPCASERFAVREADALVTDLQLVADAIVRRTGVPVELIRPGAPAAADRGTDRVRALDLLPGAYHLTVAGDGLETVLRGHRASATRLPLVVAGAPATTTNTGHRLRLLRAPVDAATLDQLHAHALTFAHFGAAPGVDRNIVRTMRASTAILARDTAATRETAGTAGFYATDEQGLARDMADAERYPQRFADIGELMAERAASLFDADRAAESWQALASRLSRGYSSRGLSGTSRPVTG